MNINVIIYINAEEEKYIVSASIREISIKEVEEAISLTFPELTLHNFNYYLINNINLEELFM